MSTIENDVHPWTRDPVLKVREAEYTGHWMGTDESLEWLDRFAQADRDDVPPRVLIGLGTQFLRDMGFSEEAVADARKRLPYGQIMQQVLLFSRAHQAFGLL